MVKAVNEAGETQSIADFVILEATPERTIDIVNTVTVEKVEGPRVRISCDQFHIKSPYTLEKYSKHVCVSTDFCIFFSINYFFIIFFLLKTKQKTNQTTHKQSIENKRRQMK